MAWKGGICIAVLLLLASCGPSRNMGPSPFEPRSERELMIVVDNRNFSDATLHAVAPGSRVRLGVVTGQTGTTYSLPWSGLNEIYIEISLLAGSSYRTQSLTVSPGDRVDLYIESTLSRSTLRR